MARLALIRVTFIRHGNCGMACESWPRSQRCAPAEWNLREIFRFSHRFWREILVKFSVAHPNPGKRSTENFTKISPKFHAKFHDSFGREKRRKNSLPHFCRLVALTVRWTLAIGDCAHLPENAKGRAKKRGRGGKPLSGPLNRLNAILSLLHPLDRFRTPSATGSAIGRRYLALSRIQTQVGVLDRLVLNRSKGSTARLWVL